MCFYYLFNHESVTDVHINCCSHLCFDVLSKILLFFIVLPRGNSIVKAEQVDNVQKCITKPLCSGSDLTLKTQDCLNPFCVPWDAETVEVM